MKENSSIINLENNKKNNGDYVKEAIQTVTKGIERLYKMNFDHRTELPEKLLFGKDDVDGVNQILGNLFNSLKGEEFDKKSSTGQFVKDCKKFEGSERILSEKLTTSEFEDEFDNIYDFLKSVKKYKRFFGSRINPLVKALDKLRIKYDKEKDKHLRYDGKNKEKKDVYGFNVMHRVLAYLLNANEQLYNYNLCFNNDNEKQNIVNALLQSMKIAYASLCRLAIHDSKKSKKREKNENKIITTGLIPWYDSHKNVNKASEVFKAILDIKNYLPKSSFKISRLNIIKIPVDELSKSKTLESIIEKLKKAGK